MLPSPFAISHFHFFIINHLNGKVRRRGAGRKGTSRQGTSRAEPLCAETLCAWHVVPRSVGCLIRERFGKP